MSRFTTPLTSPPPLSPEDWEPLDIDLDVTEPCSSPALLSETSLFEPTPGLDFCPPATPIRKNPFAPIASYPTPVTENSVCPICQASDRSAAAFQRHVAACFLERRRRLSAQARAKITKPSHSRRCVESIRKAALSLDIETRIGLMESLSRLQSNSPPTSPEAVRNFQRICSLLFTMKEPSLKSAAPISASAPSSARPPSPTNITASFHINNNRYQLKNTAHFTFDSEASAFATPPSAQDEALRQNCTTPTLTSHLKEVAGKPSPFQTPTFSRVPPSAGSKRKHNRDIVQTLFVKNVRQRVL